MKTFKIVNENSDIARLANKRVRIAYDYYDHMIFDMIDMLYHLKTADTPKNEIYGFKCKDCIKGEIYHFTADPEKIKNEIAAIKQIDPNADIDKCLAKIKTDEQRIMQHIVNGEVYMVVVEEWNANSRKWNTLDVTCMIYGWDDVESYIKTEVDKDIDCICIDKELGDINSWSTECQTIKMAV